MCVCVYVSLALGLVRGDNERRKVVYVGWTGVCVCLCVCIEARACLRVVMLTTMKTRKGVKKKKEDLCMRLLLLCVYVCVCISV